MKTLSIVIALLVISSTNPVRADENKRTFSNGYAKRVYGNVYAVVKRITSIEGRNLDKDVDESDGPEKGDIIGVTIKEYKDNVERITYTEVVISNAGEFK